MLVNNPYFRGLGLGQLRWMFTTSYPGAYQPLTWFSYAVDHAVWGMHPGGYHLTNVLIHAASTALLFRIALKLLPSRKDSEWAAVFAALLFGLHPLRVESVAWLSERKDVLSGLFYLLAVDSYVAEPRRTLRPLVWFAFGLLSKISVLTLPATLLVLDVYPLGRLPADPRRWTTREARRVLAQKAAFAALGVAAGLYGAFTIRAQGGMRTMAEVPAAARAAVAVYSFAFYLAKTAAPLRLQPYYPMPAGFGPSSAGVAGAAIGTLGALAAGWTARRRWPAATAALASYTVAIAPLLGAIKLGDQLVAEHYTYLPCMGWDVLAGAGLLILLRRPGARTPVLAGAALLCVVLGRASWTQAAVWRDSRTLWSYALVRNPENGLAHSELAAALTEAGAPVEEIRRHTREAVRLDPENMAARLNLASQSLKEGALAETEAQCEAALKINPAAVETYDILGSVRARQGRLAESEALRREALRRGPAYWRARYNLALVLAAEGKTEEAVALYREAIRRDPPNPDVHSNLGLLLAARGDRAGAAAEYRRALSQNPAHATAHYNWGNLASDEGAHERAARHYQEALRAAPDMSDARFNLCNTRTRQRRWTEATLCYREVLRREPGNAEARKYLRLVEAASSRLK